MRFVVTRLRHQVTLGVAVGFAVISTLFGLLILNVIGQSTEATAAERLKLAQTTAASIDASISHALAQLVEFAGLEAVRQATSGRARADALNQAYRLLGTYDEVAVLDARGRQVWAHPASGRAAASLRNQPVVRTALDSGAPSVALVELAAVEHPPVVAVAVPLASGGGPAGVVLGTIHFAHGWRAPLVPLPPGSATFATAVVDGRGRILVTTSAQQAMDGPGQAEPVTVDPHAPIIRTMFETQRPGVGAHGEGAEEHLVAFAPLGRLPIGVVVEERQDLALAVPNRLRRMLLLFGLVALIATSVAAWLHARYVTRPLEHLAQAMRRIPAGALDEPVLVSRRDEIGAVARSFETMRVQLARAMTERDRWERELEARVRERTDEVRRLLAKIIDAQEGERHRLARELHDDTAQTVATLLMHLAALRGMLPPGQEAIAGVLDRMSAQGVRALGEIRRVIADLRPTALDDLGLIPALREFAEARLATASVDLSFQVRGEPRRLHRPVEAALFRILQEAVTNVAKHAAARIGTVEIEFAPTRLVATVRDDGRGFEVCPGPDRPRGGVGLEGMRERADLIHARLEIASRPGAGTSIRVEIPYEE